MNNFTGSNNSQQLWKKYCKFVDNRITAVQNFIDTFNPNYVILNYPYNDNGQLFFTTEDLITLGYLIDNYNDTYSLNIEVMKPHQVIYNNFNCPLYIDDVLIDVGFAVIKKDYNNYYIMSLDSIGDYYTISSIHFLNNTCTIGFHNLDRATLIYGLNYKFSITPNNSRYCFNKTTLSTYTYYECDNNFNGGRVNYISAFTDSGRIVTRQNTLWYHENSVLGSQLQHYDIIDNQMIIEDIICDETKKTYTSHNYSVFEESNNFNGILNNMFINIY